VRASVCNAPATSLDAPTSNLQDIKHRHAEHPAKKSATPCRIHVVASAKPPWWETTSFQKCMYVHARCFVHCYVAHCIIQSIDFGPEKGNFYTYAYIIYVYTQNMYNRPLYTYINVCTPTCLHWHRKPPHPLCSWV
jgi:hypothetical protein